MASIMLDLSGFELTAEERELLQHPLVGGVILFTRNFHDHRQLRELVRRCREAARQPLLIAVDQEGGRVQRFSEGFSRIPAMAEFAQQWPSNIEQAARCAELVGWLMAAEVRACDIDISFAPVLDVRGISEVIGDRSFHQEGEKIIALAGAFAKGMGRAGMRATGKHFPGHGNVREDSHSELPIDSRPKADIFANDMRVFSRMHDMQLLDAVMPAHVVYPAIDSAPAGFSQVWITRILRQSLQFDGTVFSDDLTMAGAAWAGGFAERARVAFAAGCDMALVCNHRQGAIEVLDGLANEPLNKTSQRRLAAMSIGHPTAASAWSDLRKSAPWKEARRALTELPAIL